MARKKAPEGGEGARLYERIGSDLAQAIELGRYPSGTRLPPERELSDRYGVSRPVVREATMMLEMRGLVQRRHGAGVFVNPKPPRVSAATANAEAGPFEVIEARRLLEGEIAALAATTATPRQIEELDTILERIGDMRLDHAAREQADRAFHVALARSTGNDVLIGLVEDLWDRRYQTPLCIYIFSRAREAGIQPLVDEHRPVLEAIKTGDAEAARQAMRGHLARVTQNLLAATEADVADRARLKVEEQRFDFARRAGLSV